jgi:glycosyltransferase involved in cell wall biosynthesis
VRILHIENSSGRGGSLKSLSAFWPAPAVWEVEVVALKRSWAEEVSCEAPVTFFEKQSFFRAWRHLQKGHFDVLHVNNALIEAWSFVLAAWWEGVPVVSHFRSVRPLRKFEFFLGRICERLLVLSEAQKNLLPNFLKIEVLPNGIPDLGVGEEVEKKRVGMFSVLKKDKGHEDIITALSRIDEDWELVIAGGAVSDQPSTEDDLKRLCDEKKVSDKVKFLGHLAKPQDIMKTCSLVVDPSHKAEGLRRSICEAAMMARPVLATRVGGASDLLNEQELLAPGDIEAWEKQLRQQFSNADKARDRGQELRKKAQELFDFEKNYLSFWRIVSEIGAKRA